MILARVTGTVHATLANAHLEGQRLLLATPLDAKGAAGGQPLVCVDRVDAGIGALVLVNREGGAARIVLEDERTPVQAVIVAIVDGMQVHA